MSNAARDIALQIPVEIKIRDWVAMRWGGLVAPQKSGRDSEKDAVIYRPFKIEIKCDIMAEQTGNVFLEVFNPYLNQPSGLSATTANYWIHYIPSRKIALVFGPKKMLAELQKHPEWKRCGVGDNNSDGYIPTIQEVAAMPFVTIEEMLL